MNRYAKDLQAKRDAARANAQIRQMLEKQTELLEYWREHNNGQWFDHEKTNLDVYKEYH